MFVFKGEIEVQITQQAIGKFNKKIRDVKGNPGDAHGDSRRYIKLPTTPARLALLKEISEAFYVHVMIARPWEGSSVRYPNYHPRERGADFDRWLSRCSEMNRRHLAREEAHRAASEELKAVNQAAARSELLNLIQVVDLRGKLEELAQVLPTYQLEELYTLLSRGAA